MQSIQVDVMKSNIKMFPPPSDDFRLFVYNLLQVFLKHNLWLFCIFVPHGLGLSKDILCYLNSGNKTQLEGTKTWKKSTERLTRKDNGWR